MTGLVKTEELNINDLEAGSVAVLYDKDRLEIVTIQHINQDGNWVVMGQGFEDYSIPASSQLCRLVIISDTGTYPLKYNQWSNSIRGKEVNSDTPVVFELVPQKFKEGKHVKVCSSCTAQFLGTRSQSDCKVCCTANPTAKILVNKKPVKPKRPRIKSTEEQKALALTSFQMGNRSTDQKKFMTWLDKQF